MSTANCTTGNKVAILSAMPPMEANLIPDLEELESVTDGDTSSKSDESFGMADVSLYM